MQPEQPQNSEQWQTPQEASPQAPYEQTEQYDEPQEDVSKAELADEAYEDEVGEVNEDDDLEDEQAVVRWQEKEYIHQDRSATWFIVLGIVSVVLMALAYLLMKSLTFTLLIPVMAATLTIYIRRPPAINDYTLSRKGLHINDRLYPYSDFRSFSVVQQTGINSFVLVPRKRFQISQTVYFPEQAGEAIVDMLAARLPMKEVSPDLIDKILTRLRLQ